MCLAWPSDRSAYHQQSKVGRNLDCHTVHKLDLKDHGGKKAQCRVVPAPCPMQIEAGYEAKRADKFLSVLSLRQSLTGITFIFAISILKD